MALYDAWKRIAFDQKGDAVNHVWEDYLAREKQVYETILKEKITRIEGTVNELAAQFKLSNIHMSQFLDGIRECVDGLPGNDEIEEDTVIGFDIEFGRVYKQMVAYKAEDLYNLPQWDLIFTKEEQTQLYTEQKRSHTVVRNEEKIGRNDTCPCGSGKKYKRCCGAA